MELILNIFINIFILLFLFWMIFWNSEKTNPIRKYFIPQIQYPFIWLGLNAEWNMFAPNPPLRNTWPKVRMTLRNGKTATWEPTPIQELSVWDKIRYKKFHKTYLEVARPKGRTAPKRDFIEYLLYKYDFRDTCVKVEIFGIHQQIRPFHAPIEETPKAFQQLIYTFYPHGKEAIVEPLNDEK